MKTSRWFKEGEAAAKLVPLPACPYTDRSPKGLIWQEGLRNGSAAILAQAELLHDGMSWEAAERIADHPAVHEALEAFSVDPTGNAGVLVVKAVVEGLKHE